MCAQMGMAVSTQLYLQRQLAAPWGTLLGVALGVLCRGGLCCPCAMSARRGEDRPWQLSWRCSVRTPTCARAPSSWLSHRLIPGAPTWESSETCRRVGTGDPFLHAVHPGPPDSGAEAAPPVRSWDLPPGAGCKQVCPGAAFSCRPASPLPSTRCGQPSGSPGTSSSSASTWKLGASHR